MSDTDKLVEALENTGLLKTTPPSDATAEQRLDAAVNLCRKALPLARQLIADLKACEGWTREAVAERVKLREDNEYLRAKMTQYDDLVTEVEELREENERLTFERDDYRFAWSDVALQLGLPATYSGNDILPAVANLQSRLSAGIRAAELKDQILKAHGIEWWMIEDGMKFVDAARLSAAETGYNLMVEDLRQRLSAAESQLASFKSANEENYNRRVRAEEVVEVVKQRKGRPDICGSCASYRRACEYHRERELVEALRRYEEKK